MKKLICEIVCAASLLGLGESGARAQSVPVNVLATFVGTNGANPDAALTLGNDGNFYGATYAGGTNGPGAGDGTVFRVTTNGVLTTLVSLAGTNGANPLSGLTLGNDGNFYGTTYAGGTNGPGAGDGTVFRVTTNGVLTTLVSFAGTNGANPVSGLTLGNDGSIYGTTFNGGSSGDGTVFRVTTNGVLTLLASFAGTNGANPNEGGLTLGNDGSFYGMTHGGGTSGYGTVFQVTTNGVLTCLLSFDGVNGNTPDGGLILGRDGNFYGVSDGGGSNNVGTFFRMTAVTTNWVFTNLVSFVLSDGIYPEGLTLGNDGEFYGTCNAGGSYDNGSVFQVTTNGVLTPLVVFSGANGANPDCSVTLGADGNFYGSTGKGGTNKVGVIFELPGPVRISVQPMSQTAAAGSNVIFAVTAIGGPPLAYQWLFNGTNLSGSTNSSLAITGVSPANQGNYQVIVSNFYGSVTSSIAVLAVTGNRITPTITTLPTAGAITYGQTLASSTLSGGVGSVPGSFAFTTPTNAPTSGTAAQNVTFTPTDVTDYNSVTTNVSVTVNKATPTISTAPTASAITYGQTLASSTLSGGAGSVPGSFAFTTPTTAPIASVNQSVTFTPTDATDYNSVTTSVSVTVNKATPTITTAPTASAIIYGQTLASSTLSGGVGSVLGSFAFTVPSTTPTAGTAPQSVTFMPIDAADFYSLTTSVSLFVAQAPLTLTANNASRFYGQTNPMFTGTLTGIQNGDNITVTNATTATPSSPVGSYSITPALVDPNGRLANYTVTTNGGTLTINKAAPTITTAPTASAITYGQTLANSTLSGGAASVPGGFAFTTPSTTPPVGTSSQSVTFTPTDTNDYTAATINVSVTVSTYSGDRISSLPVTSPITYGQTLSNSMLSGGSVTDGGGTVAGSFAFSSPSNVPGVGTALQGVTFTPAVITASDTILNTSVYVTVNQATPTVTWTNPAAIVYGVPLGTNQLNAKPSVPGVFAYTPTAGMLLDTGTNSLTAVFTPTDTVDYSSVTSSVSLFVARAPLTVTASNASRLYGQTNPVFSGTITGIQNGDDITATYATRATNTSPVGAYTIVPSLEDPDGSLDNYIVTYNNGTLTVGKAGAMITWATPTAISYGTALSGAQLNATANVFGTTAYTPPAGSVLPAGVNTLTAVFAPLDTTNYNSTTSTVSLVVSPAALTVTATSLYQASTGTAFAGGNGVTYAGFVNGDTAAVLGGTLSYGGTSQGAVAAGNYSIIPSGLTAANYAISFVNGTLYLGLPPQITSQPTNQNVLPGGTAQFYVSASGTGLLTYQWWFNQTNLLTGATNTTLTLTNISLAQDGAYSVVVANNFGSATSASAVLASDSLPAISTFSYFFSGTNSGTGSRTVTFNATVNPGGLPTTVAFQYGLTTSYAAATAPTSLPGLGTETNVFASVDSIVPGVVYHVQVVATNSLGGVSTPDQSFFTPGIYPPGETNADGVVDQNELNAVLANYWPNSPWVTMTNTAGLGSLNVQFALTNASNWSFSVLVSTNLTDWQYLGPATPLYQFADPRATNGPVRYYRLRWP